MGISFYTTDWDKLNPNVIKFPLFRVEIKKTNKFASAKLRATQYPVPWQHLRHKPDRLSSNG